MYAYLVETLKPGVRVDKLQVIAILRDWSKARVKTKGYPPSPIANIELPLWTYEERERFLKERVAIHQEAHGSYDLGGTLPECSEEERWVRKGKATRCEEYCVVNKFCEQYKKED
jgi:hypothetical protein